MAITMSHCLILLLLLFIVINDSSFAHLQTHQVIPSNMTCVSIPLATLSSRNDDKFSPLKLLTLTQFYSNYTPTCGRFIMKSINTLYAKPVTSLIESFCAILQSHPMLLIYLNEYTNEHHASPAAYLFFLKLFTLLEYPIFSFHFFHPFHPADFPSLRFFQLAPTYREEARALLALMKRYDWNAFSLIIDPRLPGEEELIEEFEEHSSEPRFCWKASCNQQHHLDDKKKTIASLIVKQANNISLTGPEYMWIMSSVVLSTYSSGNEAKINPYDSPNRRKINFFTGTLALYHDVTRDSFLARFDKHVGPILINVFSKITHLNVVRQWYANMTSFTPSFRGRFACDRIFAINNSLNQPILKHILPTLYNLFKEEFKQAYGIFQQDGLALAANYSILNFQMPNNEWKKVGEYVNSTITIADIQWPGDRSKPPPGKPIIYYLKVVTLEEQPFVMLKDPSSDGKCQAGSVLCRIGPENSGANTSDPQHYQCCSGFYIDIFNILKDRLKFEFELYQVLDRTWGGRNPFTNKWNGLVAELLENRADLTLTSLKITTERNDAIDFSVPLMETGIALVVSLRPGAVSPTAFLEPYDYRIWVLVLIFTLHGVAIMVFLFEYFQNRLSNYDIDQDMENEETNYKSPLQHIWNFIRSSKKKDLHMTFFQSVWLSWVVLFRAPAKVKHPKSFTSKFMANIWACFCLAFTASYTANLAAFMITKKTHFDLSGINDYRLTNPHSMKPSFRYGTVANGFLGEQFYYYRELHAFLYDAVVLDYQSGQDSECNLRVVGNWYAMTGYGIGFPKQSKFKDMINKEIIDMHHSGEIERLRRFWFTGACKSNVDQQSQRSSRPLETLNFVSAFFLLLAGSLIAVIILLCENGSVHFWARSKRANKDNDLTEYESMLASNQNFKPSPREQLLEKRIENLQERIRELERRSSANYSLQMNEKNNEKTKESSFLVLPVTYTPIKDNSPKLEIVPFLSKDQSQIPLLIVKQSKSQTIETFV
ncbi:unnamed protein product [Rotaria sp. Silwood1]|nr:unnamed protein product [Rotaria sp. Silwood1]